MKILLTALTLLSVSMYSIAFADDTAAYDVIKNGNVTKNSQINAPIKAGIKLPPPHKDEFRHDYNHGNFQKIHPSKAEMEKKKAEIEKRLKLTDEQKKKIQENKKQGHEKVKPILEQKQAKLQELRTIYKDNNLTKEEKQSKTASLKSDIKKLNEQANSYREENMKAFEDILTDKQKKEFNKIKQEQKKDMEKRKAEFSKKMEKAKKEGKHPEGFLFPPVPKGQNIQD